MDTMDQELQPGANEGIAVPGEERPVASVESEPSAPATSDDVETRARAQGWVPKEEFRGDPEKWRDAETFVKRGEELLPVALERSRAAERKAEELAARLAAQERETAEKLARIERASLTALRRQKEQLEASYQHAMRAAVETGDVSRYDQLTRDRVQALDAFETQVNEQIAPPQRQDQPQPLAPHVQATLDTWQRANEWFTRDPELAAVATIEHGRLMRDKPGLSLEQNLAETAAYVRRRYPEKFGVTQRMATPAVESGNGRMAASVSRGKGAKDLPADVLAVAKRQVAEKLFESVDEFARDFWAQFD